MIVQREADDVSSASVPSSLQNARASNDGMPLREPTRSAMERSFGTDFGDVRVHTGSDAARASRDLNAAAFTTGQDIYFGEGRYQPETSAGQRLIAHELTHTIQQRRTSDAVVQRDLIDDLEARAQELAIQQLNTLALRPVGTPASGFTHPGCPPNFCQPFADRTLAAFDLVWARPLLLAGIAKKVNSRVVPLWSTYLSGGAAPASLTATFGADFTTSPTTRDTTTFLVDELKKDIEANHAALMGGLPVATVDFTPRLASGIAELDTPGAKHEMNFDVIGDIAGNIAGGIGKDQLTFPIGATPSPFNDERHATVSATLVRLPNGSILVTPSISFSVKDTIDLCPGNCGAAPEQVATVPMSRFEATSMAGDVPFTIDFPAPIAGLVPFVVTPPPAPPVTGDVTASTLKIRSAPSTASAVVGSYPRGAAVTLECETTGTPVDGDMTWYRTDKGFISGRFVTRRGPTPPPGC